MCRSTGQAPEHEVAHPGVDERLTGLDLVLIVTTQPTEAAPPGKRPLDNPAMRLHGKSGFRQRVGSFDDLELPAHQRPQILDQRPAIGGIGPDRSKPRQIWPILPQRVRHQACPIPVLHISGGDDDFEDEPLGIDQEMPFASTHLFVGVVAA